MIFLDWHILVISQLICHGTAPAHWQYSRRLWTNYILTVSKHHWRSRQLDKSLPNARLGTVEGKRECGGNVQTPHRHVDVVFAG